MTTTQPAHKKAADVPWCCPIELTCAALAVPSKDWGLLARWADAASPKAYDELCAYLDVMIANRCRQPTNDLMSHLIQIETADGDELTVDDVHMIIAALVAGSDTARNNTETIRFGNQ